LPQSRNEDDDKERDAVRSANPGRCPGLTCRGPFGAKYLLLLFLLFLTGCGATKNRVATEQLLVSDAVDRAIAHIDYSGLAGQKVFLDTKHIQHIKVQAATSLGPGSAGIVDASYITSSMRQQLFAAGAHVQEDVKDADYILEVRCGAIGSDVHEVVYGIPANNFLSSAASLAPGVPAVPPIPEIALAKRNDQYGAAKIGVFAYNKETKEPIWQAGIAQARSTSKDVWLFGAGPFQRGSIYDAPRFAGSKLRVPLIPAKTEPAELAKFKEEPSFHALAEHTSESRSASDGRKSDTVVAKPFEPPLPTLEEPAKLPP
jgi:hypothetical protein